MTENRKPDAAQATGFSREDSGVFGGTEPLDAIPTRLQAPQWRPRNLESIKVAEPMEVERAPGYVIFQNPDGTYWANVLEGIASDCFETIDQARQWAMDMLPKGYRNNQST